MKQFKYAFLVFLGGCCYGILSTFVKLAYAKGYTSAEVTGSQYFLGAVLIWIATLFIKREKISVKRMIKLILAGTTFGMTGIFYYQSLKTLDASMAIIFLFQFVWIGTIFDFLFNKKKPSPAKIISIIILIAGSLLAANIFTSSTQAITLSGAVWGFLSSISYTTSMFFSSKMENELPAVQKSAFLTTGALLMIFLVFPPVAFTNVSLITGIFPYALLLGFFGVFLPPLLYSIGLPHIGPSLGTMLSSSELPVAVIMSFTVLKEPVNTPQWFGVLLILAGILSGNLFSGKNSKSSSESSLPKPACEKI